MKTRALVIGHKSLNNSSNLGGPKGLRTAATLLGASAQRGSKRRTGPASVPVKMTTMVVNFIIQKPTWRDCVWTRRDRAQRRKQSRTTWGLQKLERQRRRRRRKWRRRRRGRSNSVKKSQPALPISKIDERLEQYTQAIESAGRTPKLSRQPSIELPSMAVADTKSRWETGEVQSQSATRTPSCKDIVAGDLSKKSLWEKKGDSKTSSTVKSTPSGKRYKFVATGHGKYEKVLLDEGSAP
ncbi:lymphocyte-specific protein 1 isoform X7 [Cavia porcellus]|uniref:lymphocyte-specific protein 1 isoform X7 n=1 Tax=Cavia porcellus TaxID=10141 RepID=UPI000661E166|nr:lymphocyte-specific protein 1 isoform X7 [Cavia porcellus]